MLDQKFFFLTHIKYAKANKITCLLYKYTKKSHVLSYLNDKDISDKKKMTKISSSMSLALTPIFLSGSSAWGWCVVSCESLGNTVFFSLLLVIYMVACREETASVGIWICIFCIGLDCVVSDLINTWGIWGFLWGHLVFKVILSCS